MKTLITILLLASTAFAATGQCVLTWQDSLNPPNSVTYTVYRGTGTCASNPTFVSLANGITTLNYTDTGPVGKYCYEVTAVDKTTLLESQPSNTADGKILPHSPTSLTTN